MRYFLFFLLALSSSTHAQPPSGRTADGCSYKVINGQYLTSCPGSRPAPPSSQTVAADTVTDYSAVPLRDNSLAPVPSVQSPSPSQAPVMPIVLERPPTQAILAEDREDAARERLRARLIDKTYIGALLGSNTVKAANSGGGLGLGLNLGTNIDENLGVEMAYTYAKQDLNLGLASRGVAAPGGAPATNTGKDSTLASHLFTGELQGHLTDPAKRLRPYLGLGLGWKSSTLEESSAPGLGGYSPANGSLHQSMLGGVGSAGSKLRLSRAMQLAFSFRYFFPFARQSAGLEQPASAYTAGQGTRLTRADDILTGSSQYQLLGGLQYLF